MTEQKWLKEVKQEIDNIKKYAIPEEIAKLDFKTFDPDDIENCIYGQLSGRCRSNRAAELIMKCCKQFTYSWMSGFEPEMLTDKHDDIILGEHAPEHFSSLEAYIYLDIAVEKYNKNIIAYLKGERKTLKIGLS